MGDSLLRMARRRAAERLAGKLAEYRESISAKGRLWRRGLSITRLFLRHGVSFLSLALLILFLGSMALGDALAQECEDPSPDDPFVQVVDDGFDWFVPRDDLRDEALAWCILEIRDPADGRFMIDPVYAFAVHPCEKQEARFPDLRGVAQLEIECANELGEWGPSLTEVIQFPGLTQYIAPKTTCETGRPVVMSDGRVLCR